MNKCISYFIMCYEIGIIISTNRCIIFAWHYPHSEAEEANLNPYM